MLPITFPPLQDIPHVKVCGLTRSADALLALELGATFLGLIFAKGTPRELSLDEAEKMLAEVRAQTDQDLVRPIGVFVDEPLEMIVEAVERLALTAVQIHGDFPLEWRGELMVPIVRAIRVKGPESIAEIEQALFEGPAVLDAYVSGKAGGTGQTFDHSIAAPYFGRGAVFLAGGLNPENIGAIARTLTKKGALPYAFDASSGLEQAQRIKSPEKMRAFFRELREAF